MPTAPQLQEIVIKQADVSFNLSGIRVLKTGTCPSLSGKSKLTYEIGADPGSVLCVRLSKNTGTGAFSSDWVPLDRVHHLLTKNERITSFTLSQLFKGRSANSPGFLLAVLKQEGLVGPLEGNHRCYELLDAKAFFAEIQGLLGSPAVKPKTAAKTRVAKPATARAK